MPIIPMFLYGRDVAIEVEAYVDSGAFYSIFDLELAKDIGLNIKNGRRQMFIVGDGSFIPAYVFKIPVQIGNHKFISEVAFSDKLNVGFNLLGRKGIFENFEEIIFREKKREIEFKYP
ncbi:MAG: hypothetical protein QME81_05245 [bacterium]|nr:hypothetical protein [bacterium]